MKGSGQKAILWLSVLLVIPSLIWAAGWLSSGRPGILEVGRWDPADAYLATLVLMTLFCFVTGKAVTGLWRGLLIDERNRISLSRLQTATWTVVVLSAILVAAFSMWRIKASSRRNQPRLKKKRSYQRAGRSIFQYRPSCGLSWGSASPP